MGVGGQRHAPAALPPRKTRYPLYRRLGGPQGRYGRVWKISPPRGFDPRTVQPVASRYTNCANPAPYWLCNTSSANVEGTSDHRCSVASVTLVPLQRTHQNSRESFSTQTWWSFVRYVRGRLRSYWFLGAWRLEQRVVVSTTTGWKALESPSDSRQEKEIFLFQSTHSDCLGIPHNLPFHG